jgi:hypothetical protein
MISFQFKPELDPVAVYAAVVSTLTAALGLIQWWRSGPRLTPRALIVDRGAYVAALRRIGVRLHIAPCNV